MKAQIEAVNRRLLKEDHIAICPQFGCNYIKRIKPLKFKFFGFQKYPICSKHKMSLIFIDEFAGKFIKGVNACLFDITSLPPRDLINSIKNSSPDEVELFINAWIYCIPIGRGARIVSKYFDGLSKGYIKSLNRKQRKAVQGNNKKNRYIMLNQGLKKLADEYTSFMKEFREKSERLYESKKIEHFSNDIYNIIQNWLKNQLSSIQKYFVKMEKDKEPQKEAMTYLKEKYDKILHARTSSLLLGIHLDKILDKISAFELFSVYYEFFYANLCKEVEREDIELIVKEFQEFLNVGKEQKLKDQNSTKSNKMKNENIHILDFEQKAIHQLEKLCSLINCSLSKKNAILTQSKSVLENFIIRAKKNDFSIPKNANLKVIASAIIFAVVSSSSDMPEFNIAKLSGLPASSISHYYSKYFQKLYPKQESNITSSYGFARIRNLISIYLFEMVTKRGTEVKEIISQLKDDINKKRNLPKELTREDKKLLTDLMTNQTEEFDKIFSDLTEVVKILYSLSVVHKKIGARINIKHIAEDLDKKGINLSQDFVYFYDSILNIFKFLKQMFPSIFSIDPHSRGGLPDMEGFEKEIEYRRIVGSRIKIYTITNIYNGIYFKKNIGKCPECERDKLKLNTDITKLKALEFHHTLTGKKDHYSSARLYHMFMSDRSNPNFLDDLIEKIESEKVALLCGNHHDAKTYKHFNHFKQLISWINIPNDFPQDIFSLSPEIIHTLIRISVDNHPKTKNLSIRQKDNVRVEITRLLKKRYIIETVYGEKCHICMEFNTKDHLTVFQFSHLDKSNGSSTYFFLPNSPPGPEGLS